MPASLPLSRFLLLVMLLLLPLVALCQSLPPSECRSKGVSCPDDGGKCEGGCVTVSGGYQCNYKCTTSTSIGAGAIAAVLVVIVAVVAGVITAVMFCMRRGCFSYRQAALMQSAPLVIAQPQHGMVVDGNVGSAYQAM